MAVTDTPITFGQIVAQLAELTEAYRDERAVRRSVLALLGRATSPTEIQALTEQFGVCNRACTDTLLKIHDLQDRRDLMLERD